MEKKSEKSSYEMWYEQVLRYKETTLTVDVKTKSDILELQNFFLICQRLHQIRPENKFNLTITCQKELEYRIKHFLFLAIYYDNVGTVLINEKQYRKTEAVNFYRMFPLVLINRDMFEFLSMKISDITDLYHADTFLDEQLYKQLRLENGKPDEKKMLTQVCIYNLIGKTWKNTAAFDQYRKDYFQTEAFHNKIKNLPFLALIIFSILMRSKNIDSIHEKKEKEKAERNKTRVVFTKTMAEEIFPSEEEILGDIFNAWDISDGLLQLLENIVFHAAYTLNSSKNPSDKAERIQNGEGTLILRFHTNDTVGENKEFNEDSELLKRFPQYFRGYQSEYLDGKTEENALLSQSAIQLSQELSHGVYVKGNMVENYERLRVKVEDRRKARSKIKYFLEIQVTDYSGKYMCDVFRDNLEKWKYPDSEKFKYATIRTFFDPAVDKTIKENNTELSVNEHEVWKNYYRGDNAIKHYGLQIFSSVINSNDGSFDVKSFSEKRDKIDFYSNTGSKDLYSDMLPGTKYSILLPARQGRVSTRLSNTFLNADINYVFNQLDEFRMSEEAKEIIKKFYEALQREGISMHDKNDSAQRLKKILNDLPKENRLIIFDCKKIRNNIEFEIFCKALLLLIAQPECRMYYNYISIINCETGNFVDFIRFISIYYDKNGNCDWMDNKQIYLCGIDSKEEFLVSGRNIQVMIGRVQKLAFSRRINPRCQYMLTKMLEMRMTAGEKEEKIQDFNCGPFDLLIQSDDGKTIFEQNVLKVLGQNIQTMESGCKINPTHMRLGSKIHIHSFYEAELLFYNNYYINRFAYLMADRLVKLGLDFQKPVWFIGYETYSEMLICCLIRYLQVTYHYNVHYSIYETARGSVSNREENLRYFEEAFISDMIRQEAQILLVVPINSTLTTFSKLEAVVNANIKKILKRKENISVCGYFGIIQVRDQLEYDGEIMTKMEKRYWSDINTEEKWIKSEKLFGNKNAKAYYIISAATKWEDPLICSKCYPEDCIFEVPLIETDRTSVVPTQLIGLKEVGRGENDWFNKSFCSAATVDSLKGYFYYDHVKRGSNHFHIYVRTANYFRDHENSIRDWLKTEVARKIKGQKKESRLSFDILVNPLHFSNAAFVEAVNQEVFNGASYTLRIEVEKEFRDNVETKFSDLKVLYRKLVSMGITAEMNVYYVDDSINLGANINRMRQLVSSLFPYEAYQPAARVQVHLFRDVIVLLNRLSYSSICNYVENADSYFYYLDLRISSMRTHEDACYLCKEEKNAEKLEVFSATNMLADFWHEKISDFHVKSLQEAKANKKRKGERHYERYYRRICCTHILNTRMSELGAAVNEPIVLLKLVIELIQEKMRNEDYYEYMMAYLYVYAHPFISYRKSCRESAFTLIILLLECLLEGASEEELERRVMAYDADKDLKEYSLRAIKISEPLFRKLEKDRDDRKREYYELFKLLLQLSAELKGNYITRADKIVSILKFNKEYAENKKKEKGFFEYYLALIKRILSLSLDESKSTRFEKVLVEQEHFMLEKAEESGLNRRKVEDFLKMMYVENTTGIYNAILNLNHCDVIDKETLTAYYYDNYMQILELNHIVDKVLFSENLLNLYRMLEEDRHGRKARKIDDITFYKKLSESIQRVLDAKQIQFVIQTRERSLKINSENRVVYDDIDTYKVFADSQSNIDLSGDTGAIISSAVKKEFLADTFRIEDSIAIIRYRIVLGKREESGNKYINKIVYLVADFDNMPDKIILERLRYLLVFRNDITKRISHDLNNNILQEWLEKTNIMIQIRKARSSFHTDDDNAFDFSKVWPLSEGFLFGDEKDVIAHCEKYGDKLKGCILGLMMNIRVGRANTMLLSGGSFAKEEIERKKTFGFLKNEITPIRQIYFFDKLLICDEKGKQIPDDEIFTENIYARYMAMGKEGKYYNFRSYLVYFIFEVFHSATVNGAGDENGKVPVKVYEREEYLFFENQVKDNFKPENVETGLRRGETGISLATICEFFLCNYENRSVQLIMDNQKFIIGLPIFE